MYSTVRAELKRRQLAGVIGLAAIMLMASEASAALDKPIKSDAGLVRGVAGRTPGFSVFKGIPYAAPPIGGARWRPPMPAVPWSGVREAGAFADDCLSIRPSPETRAPGQSEDCLYLNVWTPARTASERLPVMVWIYGGAFVGGSATYPRFDGDGLNRKGVILVTFNFRTGIFGFLAHPALSTESPRRVSGNYGLLDTIAALKWVKANIARFGGDPSRVTLFGQSSGSQTVNLMTVSPLGKGLFQRVIGQSGAGFGEREPKPLAQAEAAGAGQLAGFGGTVEALRRADAAALLAGARLGQYEPVVDGWILPANPHTLLAKGAQNDVPTLVGSNADESQLSPAMTREKYEAQVRERYGAKADAVLAQFPAPDDAAAPLMAKRLGTLVLGDYNIGSWAAGQARTGRFPVYQYRFTHVPPPFSLSGPSPQGAAHGAEIPYVFDTLSAQPRAWTVADRRVADLLSSYWTNFARNGNPNGPGLPRWPATREARGRLIELGDSARLIPKPDAAEVKFMDSIFYGPDGLFALK